ncbi:PREDICTED: mitogen-activated protein kinase kinase kinase 2-like [Nelumbo nucifera]|uniref:Mitogen-activated protein kinase kinase kinase 2-like n=2 Tax=Nelumbo nucifera TaxID=4432 RepID=A0A1U8AQ41_NELNU|nr:PREDICTED: mitogen-activated protein kinase kinase kinase 2-like [Nelumbo nucifera]DAD28055.1 TPA_asm: hypothetical protein HUJ06_029523 [Nelumbo nucifera]
MEKKQQHQLRWIRGNCIGKGSFGTVSLAESDGRLFAVKSVNPNSSIPFQHESLENEIRILKSLSSPYVVEYLGDDITHETATTSYRNLHMEYLPGGTIADLATQFGGKGLEERIVRSYTWCIVFALSYVHSRGIVHCDVKGRNVLVDSALGVAKLADFGSAKRVSIGDANSEDEGLILPRGSPLWMAPEVIRRERQGPEADVWSLGCTIIEMITGKPAWTDCGDAAATMFRICFSDELPEAPAQLSELGRDFLSKCLKREPSERWSCEQLLRHPFVSAGTITEPSPRCVLDWSSSEFCDDGDEDEVLQEEEEEAEIGNNCVSHDSVSNFEVSARERIRELATDRRVLWESDGWEVVRRPGSVCDRGRGGCGGGGGEGREGTSSEYSNLIENREERTGASSESGKLMSGGEEIEGTCSEYLNSIVSCFRVGGEWPCLVITCCGSSYSSSSSCGYRDGSSCQHGLQGEKMGFYFYSWCKLLLSLLSHIMKIQIPVNMIFIFGSSSENHNFTISLS